MAYLTAYLPTPLGVLELQASDTGLRAAQFTREAMAPTLPGQVPECLREAYRQLQAYFRQELQEFDLRLDVTGGTEFQRRVWTTLPSVAYGRTASYLDLARQLGNPAAVRAVGAANGQNPLTIIWPCHRIIGSGGHLTGYAGGLHRKQWLLAFEQPTVQTTLFG